MVDYLRWWWQRGVSCGCDSLCEGSNCNGWRAIVKCMLCGCGGGVSGGGCWGGGVVGCGGDCCGCGGGGGGQYKSQYNQY